jgi:D-threonine aldolase
LNWFEVSNAGEIPSPALLLFPDRIDANIAEMIRIAGAPDRLRPHLKTHKIPELIRRQKKAGVEKFKAATLAEAVMAARAGAEDILLACQPVGPSVSDLVRMAGAVPATRFSCVADNAGTLNELSAAASSEEVGIGVFIDLDIGQHRTGANPDVEAETLYRIVASLPGLEARGFHAYDGHIADSDPATRIRRCTDAWGPVEDLRRRLEADGFAVPTVVAGGSPTFPIHAARTGVELSPGTTVLWDAGYASKLPDLPFLPAAVLLCRVTSKPTPDRLCLDLGHKAVGSEMPHPRVTFLNLLWAVAVMHSEEHLAVITPEAANRRVGDLVYALPWHVCPTVALHDTAYVVRNGAVAETWSVTARTRRWACLV